MLSSYLFHNNDKEINEEIAKFDKLIFMEYGLKCGHDFEKKCQNLNYSGFVCNFVCENFIKIFEFQKTLLFVCWFFKLEFSIRLS